MAHGVGLADILRDHGRPYLDAHALSTVQDKAWRAIVACRTPALGGHVECCDHCGVLRYMYHSCRNRHCPQCQTRAKEAWLAARRRELLPVPYFHLVFTLPHALNGLAGCVARTLYKLLFGAVADTLNSFAANPRWLGGTPSFTLVLHTWKQDLGRHIHIHALVAGGALTADGKWVSAKRGFLFPIEALSSVYRGKFMEALDAARKAGALRHESAQHDASWRNLVAALYRHDWVVYAKQPLGGPAQVLEYLGRYTHRVAISNERILGMEGGRVRFRVRDSANGNRKKVVRLDAGEFIGRFLLHVLPSGFKRIRHYGLLGSAHKAANLAAAREALEAPTPDPVVVESVEAFMRRVAGIEWLNCPHCREGRFMVLQGIAPHLPRAPPRTPS
ncbi:MAG: IS91 family transposase [Gallionella sp.]|nr:IS91 family transposase [Gallionella sp.]